MERNHSTSWAKRFIEESFLETLAAGDALSSVLRLSGDQAAVVELHLEQLRTSLARRWLQLFLENALISGEQHRN